MDATDSNSGEPFIAKTVHVDTSLLIERQKEEKKARPVRLALSKYSFQSTSTYARKEFKRAWLTDLAWLYKTVRQSERIEEVYNRIHSSFWHPGAKRRLNRCFDALTKFMSVQKPSLPIGALLKKLESYLAEMILGGFQAWERQVTHEFAGTGCVRAKERPIRSADGTIDAAVPRCKPSKIQCTVHEFFAERSASFRAIDAAIAAASQDTVSEELVEASKTIRLALSNPKVLCDDANCRRISDALIAVDGITSDHFAANNPREWETIAAALGKPLINPVADAKAAVTAAAPPSSTES